MDIKTVKNNNFVKQVLPFSDRVDTLTRSAPVPRALHRD